MQIYEIFKNFVNLDYFLFPIESESSSIEKNIFPIESEPSSIGKNIFPIESEPSSIGKNIFPIEEKQCFILRGRDKNESCYNCLDI